ncbi:hypothetical protein CR194_16510 [Salipaludibacillus keqinensis]|uniref:Uncharacterized protein n=1 Tax=Salipaludibacillus keqinensis TaxID=2045207 RepID=A0A323TB63_9BACI|nr:hypothetical protein CR194_16510 [Salipaludibacillus keqinensis]
MKCRVFLLLFLIVGCSQDDKEEMSGDFTGRVTGPADGFDTLLVLKEDTLGGTSVINNVNRHRISEYSVNAYRVMLSSSTEIVDEDGEIHMYGDLEDSAFQFMANREIKVRSNEEWEEKWTELDRYLSYQPRFLPVYKAEKIELLPYGLEDFINFHSPLIESKFFLMTFHKDDDDITIPSNVISDLTPHLHSREQISWQSFFVAEDNPIDRYVHTDPMSHLVLSNEGKEILTDDWQEVIDYFKEREGD